MRNMWNDGFVKKAFLALFLGLLLALMGVGGVLAQDTQPPTDDEVNAIARQLFCPVCENTPLDVCPTEACKQWRELIRLKLSEGWTEEQIKQYFVDQYGARVLSEPPRQGWYWLIYLVPVALLLVGVYILFRAYQSMRAPLPAQEASDPVASPLPASLGDDYLRRVEEELKKRT
ncbi:MAG: cytochrome c-type biogenesis protein CcmH [Anaerolineales bacterium]|nr:cytochrome c-type biogenesis protein CcmH [Anaerolineales bacterium]MDW8277627.1 cytochrome c-type biogenesis protein CcmH [Anaerolineales bacterium]